MLLQVAALGMREALLEAVQHLSEESPDEPIDMTASMSVTGLSRVPRSGENRLACRETINWPG